MIRRTLPAISRILFQPMTTSKRPRLTAVHRQLLSTAIDNAQPQLSTSANHFCELDRTVKKKARSKFASHWDLLKMQSKMFKFTPDDWHVFLCAFSALGEIGQRIYFQHNDPATATRMVEAMAKHLGHFLPIDYFNFIRFLESRNFSFEDVLPANVQETLCKWFVKNYAQLESSAFFEILMAKACWLEQNMKLGIEKDADVIMFLEHGTKLARESPDISAALRMIHAIELYSNENEKNRSEFTSMIGSLVESLATKVSPSNQNDHFATLSFITGLQERPFRFRGIRTLKTSHVFHRYATGRSDDNANTPMPAANLQWLRNSIEIPFGNNDFAHLRQLAAFAAVDAYSSRTVNFSLDEMERYLYQASEPFLMNPAVIFEPTTTDVPTVTRMEALKVLLKALYLALDIDPDDLGGRLRASSIRFDFFYWERFDNMLRTEASKLKDEERPLVLDSISKSLYHLTPGRLVTQRKLHKKIFQKDKMIVAKPIMTAERKKLIDMLKFGPA